MKRTRFLQTAFTLAATLLLLAGCSNDELSDSQGETLPEGKYPLELTVRGLEAVATPATRNTVDNTWTDVEYVAVSDGGSKARKYKVTVTSPDDKSASLSALDNVTPFYWKSSSEKKKIEAWHPYSSGYLGNSWKVQADQSGEGYQTSDLIYSTLDLQFSDRDNSQKNIMDFKHMTARIVVELNKENCTNYGFTEDHLKSATVQIVNITGVNNDNKITNMHPVKDDDYSQCALVMPQTISAGRNLFSISIKGYDSPFYYTPTEKIEWKAEYQYTYTITVQGEILDVSTGSTISWDPTGGSNGNGTIGI